MNATRVLPTYIFVQSSDRQHHTLSIRAYCILLYGIRLGWVQDILHQQSVYANVMADLMIFYFMKLHFLLNAIENYGVR